LFKARRYETRGGFVVGFVLAAAYALYNIGPEFFVGKILLAVFAGFAAGRINEVSIRSSVLVVLLVAMVGMLPFLITPLLASQNLVYAQSVMETEPRKAQEALEAAIKLDSTLAEAHAMLAEMAFREVVIVDECSDLFLRCPHITQEDMKTSREVLSRISRMGRAVGIHLILATQRPDAAAIDSQVKSNLSGVIAFRAANLATSMTILGNARATELPAEIKGRAIWRADGEYFEVQTPHLSAERASSILSQFKSETIAVDLVATQAQHGESSKDAEDGYGL
jgi:hypothetical protein